MSILDDFLVYIRQIVHHNIQLRQIFQPILAWMHHVTLENLRLHHTIENLSFVIDVQSYRLQSLQEENVSLLRSFSTASIELQQLHLKYRDPRGHCPCASHLAARPGYFRDDVDSEAETVISEISYSNLEIRLSVP